MLLEEAWLGVVALPGFADAGAAPLHHVLYALLHTVQSCGASARATSLLSNFLLLFVRAASSSAAPSLSDSGSQLFKLQQRSGPHRRLESLPPLLMDMSFLDQYESKLQTARARFDQDPMIGFAFKEEPTGAPELHLFLIYFSSLGVAMTEPVEGWISRAGKKCEEVGLQQLGKALQAHARHEAGHHLMMIEDTHSLIKRWNQQYPAKLDAGYFLELPPTSGVQAYRKLHEDVIASDAPCAQIAIEYEIESLSVRYGNRMIQKCSKILGSQALSGMTFIKDHTQFDVGHTKFNQKQLSDFLESHPKYLVLLVDAGERALDAYRQFLGECLQAARNHSKSIMG